MDNFRWLEEDEPKKKSQWLKNYWIHLTAVVIIILLLLYLFAGSNPKSANNEQQTTSQEFDNTKQITIRLPDKTTKVISSQPDINAYDQEPLTTAFQEQESLPLLAEEPTQEIIEKPKPETQAKTSEAKPTEKRVSRLIQPKQQELSSIGVIAHKNPTTTVTPAAAGPTTPPTVELQSTPIPENETLNIVPAAENTALATAPTTEVLSETTKSPATVNAAATQTATTAQAAQTNTNTSTTFVPSATTPAASSPAPANNSTTATVAPANSVGTNLHWLLKRQASHYTIQLFASHQETAVQNYINQNNLNGKAVYAKMWQNNQDWFVVLMGDYNTREEAISAISQLSPTLQNQSPWARSMQSVQDSLRQRLARGD